MSADRKGVRDSSGKLWSLLELMLKKAALDFGRTLHTIGMTEALCDHSSRANPLVRHDPTGQLQPLVMQMLGDLKRVCILADMDDLLPEIDRFGQAIGPAPDIKDVHARTRHLRERVFDELSSEFYVQVARENVRLYEQPAAFGEAVAKAFPAAGDDLRNAGNCLALEQPMAAIFHLMRALELAILKLAAKLKITVSPKDTWGMILGNMTSAIQKMPDKSPAQKAKRERWSEARTNLFHVKEAWRDNSLHARRKRATMDEATEIYAAVRVFMQTLASL
jgi:hypothetical protein